MDTKNHIPSRRIIFLHHPKTGGTTLHDLLVQQLDKSLVSTCRHNNQLLNASDEEISTRALFSGHYARNGVSKVDTKDSVKITILRHPADRLLSLYNFWRSHKDEHIERHNLWYVKLAKEVSFEEFIDPKGRLSDLNYNAYCRTLMPPHLQGNICKMSSQEAFELALEYLNTFDFVFVTPLLSIQIPSAFPALGFKPPAKIGFRREISDHYTEEPFLQKVELYNFDAKVRAAATETNRADFMLYDHFLSDQVVKLREEVSAEIINNRKKAVEDRENHRVNALVELMS